MKTIIAKSRCKDKYNKDMRFEMEWLLECLLIRVKSPATYEHLRVNNILPLPSKDTLRKMISSLSPEFGFNDFALQCIRRNLKNKSLPERYGSLMWDEMSITQDLHFDKHTFKFKGFTYLRADPSDIEEEDSNISALDDSWKEEEENSVPLETPELADHALVIIFRPFKERWIQPIGVFASKNAASGTQLHKLILKAIILLEECDARVLTTVCDGSQPNNTAWKLFGIFGCNSDTAALNHKMKHPTADGDIYFLRDVPHLFKCIRNHIFNHKEVQVCVSWKVVIINL